jgi:uncharacterized protein YbaR (Trm112 family)
MREKIKILVCPYCEGEVSLDILECCGEHQGHFQERLVWSDTREDVKPEDEIEETEEEDERNPAAYPFDYNLKIMRSI